MSATPKTDLAFEEILRRHTRTRGRNVTTRFQDAFLDARKYAESLERELALSEKKINAALTALISFSEQREELRVALAGMQGKASARADEIDELHREIARLNESAQKPSP